MHDIRKSLKNALLFYDKLISLLVPSMNKTGLVCNKISVECTCFKQIQNINMDAV